MSGASGHTGGNRRVLDIEDVLIWTYRDELPKRAEERGFGEPCSVSPMFRNASLGGRIDNWSREPGMPAALGDPHPDALLVEQEVIGLAKLRDHSHAGVAPDWLAPDFSGLEVDQVGAFARAQRTVDLLVTVNARLRRRPPFEGTPLPAMVPLANGKPSVVAPARQVQGTIDGGEVSCDTLAPTSAIRSGVYHPGAQCPLRWSPSPGAVLLERAEYAVWHAALTYLAERLAGSLSSIAVLPPSAPSRPWLGEVDTGKPTAILDDGRTRIHRAPSAATPRPSAPPRRRGQIDRGRHLPREQWPTALARLSAVRSNRSA